MTIRYHHLRLGSILAATIVLLAGCSWGSSYHARPVSQGASYVKASTPCQWNPSACMYKGSYEPGEDVYAEQEAARLNRAEAARLGRRLF